LVQWFDAAPPLGVLRRSLLAAFAGRSRLFVSPPFATPSL